VSKRSRGSKEVRKDRALDHTLYMGSGAQRYNVDLEATQMTRIQHVCVELVEWDRSQIVQKCLRKESRRDGFRF